MKLVPGFFIICYYDGKIWVVRKGYMYDVHPIWEKLKAVLRGYEIAENSISIICENAFSQLTM